MNYYKRLDKSDYFFKNAPIAIQKSYEGLKTRVGVVVSTDEKGEFLLVPTEMLDEFIITAVSREDVRTQGYNPDNLSDSDMQDLADRMAEAYIEYGNYWDEIECFAQEMECEQTENEEEED